MPSTVGESEGSGGTEVDRGLALMELQNGEASLNQLVMCQGV